MMDTTNDNKQEPTFIVCPNLITYNDFSHTSNADHKQIAVCQCKAFREEKQCKNRGKCILARESYSWKVVSSKSW